MYGVELVFSDYNMESFGWLIIVVSDESKNIKFYEVNVLSEGVILFVLGMYEGSGIMYNLEFKWKRFKI